MHDLKDWERVSDGNGNYRFSVLFRLYWNVLGGISAKKWRDKLGCHPDKECGTCRTYGGHLAYFFGDWQVMLRTDSVLGGILREVHAWRKPKTRWCRYDYSNSPY